MLDRNKNEKRNSSLGNLGRGTLVSQPTMPESLGCCYYGLDACRALNRVAGRTVQP